MVSEIKNETRWLLIINDTEIEMNKTIDSKDQMVEILKPEFKHLESLNNYEIYRRRTASDKNDDDEDDNSDNDDEGDSEN